jgi:imidazolonepropionase
MADHGTTTLELKTVRLSVEGELRQARLARRLAEEAPQTCTVTLLACHAVPEGVERRDWVRTVCEVLIPAAAAEGLVDAVDVYVEDIAFSVEDLERRSRRRAMRPGWRFACTLTSSATRVRPRRRLASAPAAPTT